MSDTIFAFATGEARSAIAVLRASGPMCEGVLHSLCSVVPKARVATLSIVRDPVSGGELDQALVLWFPGPSSFTGEDCFELHLHGGRAVRQAVVAALQQFAGCRTAKPGEFTRRAFHNGKMDLTELEALGDLIVADTELQRRQALSGYRGRLASRAAFWRTSLLDCMGLLEAHLDFADEGDAPKDVIEEAMVRVEGLRADMAVAVSRAGAGEMVRGGARVVLAGPPNAGKSSLLNAIAQRDVAIVSDLAGTTRDVLEVRIELGGLEIVFCDTAGLREPEGKLEALGIERAHRTMDGADVILWLWPCDGGDFQHPLGDDARVIGILSKSDLLMNGIHGLSELFKISSATGAGLEALLDFIASKLSLQIGFVEDVVLVNRRQKDCVERSIGGLENALLLDGASVEVFAEEIRHAVGCLDELIGVVSVDHVLDVVFSRFCMGK